MFNVGLGEILVIALVALLVFGPNRLPEIMRNLGKALRTLQAETQEAADVLKKGLEEPQAPAGAGVVDRPDVAPEASAVEPVPPPEPIPQTETMRVQSPSDEPPLSPAAREYEDT